MLKKLFVIALMFIAFQSFGQGSVISANDFAAELKGNKNLVVIDVNSPDVYAKQHIQGAINVYVKDLYKSGPVEGQLKSNEELAIIFGKKGVSNKSKIVVYEDGTNKHNSRVWYVLKSLGATDVSALHVDAGQFSAAQILFTATPATKSATTYALAESNYKTYTMADIKKLPEGTLLLDGREKAEFDGVDTAKKSKGHIPGAVWMNYREVLTPTGAYKSKDEIIAAAAKFSVTPEKPIVVYCNSGVKATVLYIAFKEIAGFQNVQYYAGSYADWVSKPENQIVK